MYLTQRKNDALIMKGGEIVKNKETITYLQTKQGLKDSIEQKLTNR